MKAITGCLVFLVVMIVVVGIIAALVALPITWALKHLYSTSSYLFDCFYCAPHCHGALWWWKQGHKK